MRFVAGSALTGAAVVFAVMGASLQYRSRDATPEPLAVELAKLEAGGPLSNRHVRVGRHLALFQATLYLSPASYRPGDPSAPVEHAWYPILSPAHPVTQQLERLASRYGGLGRIPSEAIPPLKSVAMMVYTKRFQKVGDIPDGGMWRDQARGLSDLGGGALGWQLQAALQDRFPDIRPETIRVLEEGVTPPDGKAAGALMVFGALLLVPGLGLLVTCSKGAEADAGADRGAGPPKPRDYVGCATTALRVGGAACLLLVASACLPFAKQRFELCQQAALEPLEVDVASIEKGAGVPGPHVLLGRHLALYQGTIFAASGETPEAPETRPRTVWYPIFSQEHPDLPSLRELGKAYGGVTKIPREALPGNLRPTVYVRTRRFATVADIPAHGEVVESRQGLVMGKLGDQYPVVLKQLRRVPEGTDFGAVYDVFEDRKPPELWETVVTLLIAAGFATAAVRLLFPPKRA